LFQSYVLDLSTLSEFLGPSYRLKNHTQRVLDQIKKKLLDGRYPVIECIIEADGFLYNMVRSITGTLLEAAKLRMPEGGIRKILMKKNRAFAGPTLPARGLCLMEVKY